MSNLTFKTRVTPEAMIDAINIKPYPSLTYPFTRVQDGVIIEQTYNKELYSLWPEPEIPAEEAIRRLHGDRHCEMCMYSFPTSRIDQVSCHCEDSTNYDGEVEATSTCVYWREQPQPDESELKPCPFCGGEAELWKPDAVGCPDCCIYTDPELWNTRK